MSRVLIALVLPFIVFIAVGGLMANVTGRSAALAAAHPPNPKPLNTRFSYDVRDVDGFWGALGREGLVAEQRFLEFDLTFPTIYGGALIASLVWLCRRAGWHEGVIVAPVVVGMVADWTENLVQLEQLRRYAAGGTSGLDARAVEIASLATATKLIGVGLGFVLLFVVAAAARRHA